MTRPAAPGRVYRIVIPNWHPRRLNEYRGRHWSAEHRAKNEAEAMVRAYGLLAAHPWAERVPPATGRRRVALTIVLSPRQRPADRDAYDKVVLDALVRCGLLLDDSPRGLDGRVAVRFLVGVKRETWIELEDVP
jgi:hypothetical protein